MRPADGDLEKAVDVLRQKGAAKADKRAGRDTSEGLIGSYVHHDGGIAALVELNCETDFVARLAEFKILAKELVMHVAAAKPLALGIEHLSPEIVQRERQVYEAQIADQKKPENIRGKIVDGMMKKFYEERVLLEQKFFKGEKRTVDDLIKEFSAKTGEKISVRRFVRLEVGSAPCRWVLYCCHASKPVGAQRSVNATDPDR